MLPQPPLRSSFLFNSPHYTRLGHRHLAMVDLAQRVSQVSTTLPQDPLREPLLFGLGDTRTTTGSIGMMNMTMTMTGMTAWGLYIALIITTTTTAGTMTTTMKTEGPSRPFRTIAGACAGSTADP